MFSMYLQVYCDKIELLGGWTANNLFVEVEYNSLTQCTLLMNISVLLFTSLCRTIFRINYGRVNLCVLFGHFKY